jgi:hydroxypyruvate isomerase
MANIGVCLETFFSNLDYRQRIESIARLGFRYYEFWFHDKRFDGSRLHDEARDFDCIAELNEKLGLVCTDFIFNHPDAGIRAALIDKRDRNLILDSLGVMIERAKRIGCRAFISGAGNVVPGLSRAEAMDTMIETLGMAAAICAKDGITLLLEPFNTRVDHPDYFLDSPHDCLAVVKAVDRPNVRVLYDIYHMQIMAGDITAFIRANLPWIGHFHVAGVPGRHEPRASELNYPFIVAEIDRLGYTGGIGLEYWPTTDSATSLRQTRAWLSGQEAGR